MSVHSRAPLRIDFAGGWTDVPIFAEREGGAVVNGALSLSVRADFLLGGQRIRLVAEDLDERLTIASPGLIRYDGKLDLHKAALNMLPVTGGIEILTRADAPGGSGLGTSGALDVALLAGLARCRKEEYSPDELAELGFMLEAGELGLLGGRQDQYGAALGWFHEFTFTGSAVARRRLDVAPEAAADLARHLVLVYTGHSHFSSATHARVWSAYEAGDSAVCAALRRIGALATPAAQALEAGDWRALAAVMFENWREQQRLDPTISTARVRAIEQAALGAGVWGLKATGAGAGGCVALLGPMERREEIVAAVTAAQGQVLETTFMPYGVVVWVEDDVAHES